MRETITEGWAPSGYLYDRKSGGSAGILLVCPRPSSAALLRTPITTILSRLVAAAPLYPVAVAPSLLSPLLVTCGR